MASFLDIVPPTTTVDVYGSEVEILGISANAIGNLIARFPEIRSLLSNGPLEFTAEKIVEMGPAVVASVIAAGTGHAGSKKAEEIAARLPLGTQLELLEPIVALTLPQGPASFLETLVRLVEAAGGKKAPATA